jgi:hypothetical protein
MTLPVELATELARYQHALARAPLTGAARLTYIARVRGFLAWLAATRWPRGQTGADPLQDRAALDAAMRDWRAWAMSVGRQTPVTINNTLAAIEDFYSRRRLGAATARQQPLSRPASTPAP